MAAHIYLDIKMLDGEVWIQTPPLFSRKILYSNGLGLDQISFAGIPWNQ
jgi:hypothetical protein